jgi:hypothetical protein
MQSEVVDVIVQPDLFVRRLEHQRQLLDARI